MSYISQEEMAFRYVQGFQQVGKSFKSEFRDEGIASSRLWWNQYGYLIFKDFGDPNIPDGLTMIQYVSHKYGIDEQSAINKIAQDFKLIGGSSELGKVSKRKKIMREFVETPSNPTTIKIKKRPWGEHDISYWGQYYITTDLLEDNNICAISHVWFNDKPAIEFAKDYNVYCYNYYFHKESGVFQRKIYQPLNTTGYKWFSNVNNTTVQHVDKISKTGGDLLIITSSLKDAIVLGLLGYSAIAPNSESSFLPTKYWIKIKGRWKIICLYLDNDNAGITYAKKLNALYDIPYIHNPLGESKDISDYVKKYNLSKGRELVENLISKNT